jgi:hypothetical protein
MPNHLNKASLLLFLIAINCIAIGCYEPEDGCLDLWAKNYDVSSDNSCDDCCTYPNIVVTMDHLWADSTFLFGDTLSNDTGTSVVLLDQKIHLSNWNYNIASGGEFIKLDSIQLTKGESVINIDKDILLIRKNQASATNHTYKGEGQLTSFNFTYGVADQLDGLSLLEAEIYDVLQYDNFMRADNKYQSAWFQLAVGEGYKDTIGIFLEQDIALTVTSDAIIDLGENLSINIGFDYDVLFSGIDFQTSNKTTIRNMMIENQTNWIK